MLQPIWMNLDHLRGCLFKTLETSKNAMHNPKNAEGTNPFSIASIWRENMLRYLSADIICSEKRTVFRERSSRKTVSFEEQIMSKDKYLSIFLKSNGGYCVYYPSNIFRNMRKSRGYRQDLPFCHMSITSKFVSWLPKSPHQISLQVEIVCLGKR